MKYAHIELLYRVNWNFKRDCVEAEPQFKKHTVAGSQVIIIIIIIIIIIYRKDAPYMVRLF